MMYEFQSENGEIIELSLPMSKAPPLGKVITRNGKKYKRILSSSTQVNSEFEPYISVAAPKGLEKLDPSIKVDRSGRPVIENRRQEREVARRTGNEWL